MNEVMCLKDVKKVTKFIYEIWKCVREAIGLLKQNERSRCYRYNLDEDLAIFVGWSGGYSGHPGVIHSKTQPDYAIEVGVKLRRDEDDADYGQLDFPWNDDGDYIANYFTPRPNMSEVEYIMEIAALLDGYQEIVNGYKAGLITYCYEFLTAYKLFRLKNGKLYPLYVNSDQSIPLGIWMKATEGVKTPEGKVKSKLGLLAFRPGFHLTKLPYAGHIGKKIPGHPGLYQAEDTVWCRVRCHKHNYTPEAVRRGRNPRDQYLKFIPKGGYYRYRTNPAATVDWYIAGEMIVDAILTQTEVDEICRAGGIEPQKTVAQIMQQEAEHSDKR